MRFTLSCDDCFVQESYKSKYDSNIADALIGVICLVLSFQLQHPNHKIEICTDANECWNWNFLTNT